jgi:hypothetical protein
VLLRKLRVPIADIEQIFLSGDGAMAVRLLTKHLESMRAESAVLNATATLLDALLQSIQGRELPAVFDALEQQEQALQILLSERKLPMFMDENVRIVRLPAMTVAASCFGPYGTHDGMTAANYALDSFCAKNDLLRVKPDVRRFNLCAHRKNPDGTFDMSWEEHTFELWVSIPADMEVPEPLIKREFKGGLYAAHTIPCGAYDEWTQLHDWGLRQEHITPDWASRTAPETSDRDWVLEEVLDFVGQMTGKHPGQQQVDLLLPVKAID